MAMNTRVRAVTLIMATALPMSAQETRPAPDAIARAVDSLAAHIVRANLTPALGVAVVMDGKTIYAKSHGFADVSKRIPADDRTLWYVASTTKSYTGFAIALLAHQGVLRLDQPIGELLPGVPWHDGADAPRLTLARFLSHTHYLNDNAVVQSAAFTGEIPEARWPQLVRLATPIGRPDLVYSNFGYNVAAMVIDAKRPEGWRRYLEQAIYTPAGLRETYARVSGIDAARIAKPHGLNLDGSFFTHPFFKTDATMNSAGGHIATLTDLARWTIVQMDGGMIDGRRVFPAEAVALSHKLLAPHTVEASKRFGPFARDGWAAGWDIGTYDGEPMVSRFGGYMTIRSHLSFLPRRRIGVVAQTTGLGSSSTTDIVAQLAYDLEAGKPNARALAMERVDQLIARRPATLQQRATQDSTRKSLQVAMDKPLSDFAGSYVNDAFGTVTFTLSGGALSYRWGAVYGPAEVADARRRQLRIEVATSGTIVTFNFGASGPAQSITLQGQTFLRR
jgi:CubicO group peptidase (beta-lactamase class C family)